MNFTLRQILLAAAVLLPVTAAGQSGETLAQRVERAAVEAAQDHVQPPDRLEVLSSRFAGADPHGPEGVALEPVWIEGPNSSGVIKVRFRMLAGGLPKGEARATVRGRVHGPALRTARTLPRDTVIVTDDLKVEITDLTRLTEEPLRGPEQALGMVAVRTLGEGRVLTGGLLRPEPVVRRGDTVDLRVEREGLVIRALGEVLRDGIAGEVVPAENSRTGARVLGQIQPDGSLLVVRPGGDRRL